MANPDVRRHLILAIEGALAKAKLASTLEHSGLVGRAREIVVGDLIAPLLPPEIRIGSGKIIDHVGSQSLQSDVVAYLPGVMPPFLWSTDVGTFPVESCVFAIEVKSKITANELKDAVKKARSIHSLRWVPVDPSRPYEPRATPPLAPQLDRNRFDAVVALVFAFESDLSGSNKTELIRYKEIDQEHAGGCQPPLVSGICIPGSGYSFWGAPRSNPTAPPRWIYQPATPEHDEVLVFLASLVDTIPDHLNQRSQRMFGYYISDEKDATVGAATTKH